MARENAAPMSRRSAHLLAVALLVPSSTALRSPFQLPKTSNNACSSSVRRTILPGCLAAALLPPLAAEADDAAPADCLGDCVRECNLVAVRAPRSNVPITSPTRLALTPSE